MKTVKYSELSGKKVKKTVKVRKGRFALLISFILLVVVDLFLVAEYKARGSEAIGYKLMEKVNQVFESGSDLVTSIWEPQLKQDESLTSVLIVGIDTRNVEFTGKEFVSTSPEGQAGTRNADTIMQVVYDHTSGDVFMISIPRDMGVDIRKECLDFHGSLHWVYDKGQAANCPGGGVQTMSEVVESVTGIPVHYYAFISLDAFVDIIEAVGDVDENGERGIWIDIAEPVYELYPANDYGWENVYFPAGHQFLDSEMALKYARSRKYSSDFARAERQQQVISAVKDRILSSDTLSDPKKLYSLYKAFKKNALFSELSVEDIRAALNLARDFDETDITHIVLDPTFGGKEVFLNKIPHDRPGGPYYMVPTAWKECGEGNEFCKVKDFIHKIKKYPEIYAERASVFVYARGYDSSWQPNLNNEKYQALKNNGLPIVLIESQYLANIQADADIVIYDFSDGNKSKALEILSKELGVPTTPGSEASWVRINKEDIAIVINGK
ncbi:MAG: LCP family protein [Candidatus Dojkabacteria bacterium]|nr:LCP family protein [Candidatus Dojkabacteria bacterium]